VQIEKVIQDCLEGKEGAWEMLVNTYSKRIFNMAYQFAGSYQEAEDLTQEIFLRLHNQLSKYDFAKNFTAWFLTLSKNYLIDEYRRTKWEKVNRDEFNEHLLYHEHSESPESSLLKEESKKIVWESLNLLSSEIRMAIILRDIQGNLRVDGKSVDIYGKLITGQEIYISSSYENIELLDFSGRTTILLSHGDLVLQPSPLAYPVEIKNEYSSIRLYWPTGEKYPFEAQVKGGDIKWNLAEELSLKKENSLSVVKAFVNETEKPSIFLSTTYGDIRIEQQ
jgi:RNA polymerase sigma-70 factor (ECF subfamily)